MKQERFAGNFKLRLKNKNVTLPLEWFGFTEIENFDEVEHFVFCGEKLLKYLPTAMNQVKGRYQKDSFCFDAELVETDKNTGEVIVVIKLINAMVESATSAKKMDTVSVVADSYEFGLDTTAARVMHLHVKNERTAWETRPEYSNEF